MLKKALFVAVFLGLLASPTIPAKAQTFSVEQQASLDSLRQQIIDLLLQQLALLQAQLADLLAKQANQETQLGAVAQDVQTVVERATKPVPPPTPVILLKIIGGTAGSMQTLFLPSTRVGVNTNKEIDIAKTELWVDGVKREITTTPISVSRWVNAGNYYETIFDITPSVYSFARPIENGYQTTLYFKFATANGEIVSSLPMTCEVYKDAYGEYQDTWGARRCNLYSITQ